MHEVHTEKRKTCRSLGTGHQEQSRVRLPNPDTTQSDDPGQCTTPPVTVARSCYPRSAPYCWVLPGADAATLDRLPRKAETHLGTGAGTVVTMASLAPPPDISVFQPQGCACCQQNSLRMTNQLLPHTRPSKNATEKGGTAGRYTDIERCLETRRNARRMPKPPGPCFCLSMSSGQHGHTCRPEEVRHERIRGSLSPPLSAACGPSADDVHNIFIVQSSEDLLLMRRRRADGAMVCVSHLNQLHAKDRTERTLQRIRPTSGVCFCRRTIRRAKQTAHCA